MQNLLRHFLRILKCNFIVVKITKPITKFGPTALALQQKCYMFNIYILLSLTASGLNILSGKRMYVKSINKTTATEQVSWYVNSVKELTRAAANQDTQSKNRAHKIGLNLFKLPYRNQNRKPSLLLQDIFCMSSTLQAKKPIKYAHIC